jgi:hypothetical protein
MTRRRRPALRREAIIGAFVFGAIVIALLIGSYFGGPSPTNGP